MRCVQAAVCLLAVLAYLQLVCSVSVDMGHRLRSRLPQTPVQFTIGGPAKTEMARIIFSTSPNQPFLLTNFREGHLSLTYMAKHVLVFGSLATKSSGTIDPKDEISESRFRSVNYLDPEAMPVTSDDQFDDVDVEDPVYLQEQLYLLANNGSVGSNSTVKQNNSTAGNSSIIANSTSVSSSNATNPIKNATQNTTRILNPVSVKIFLHDKKCEHKPNFLYTISNGGCVRTSKSQSPIQGSLKVTCTSKSTWKSQTYFGSSDCSSGTEGAALDTIPSAACAQIFQGARVMIDCSKSGVVANTTVNPPKNSTTNNSTVNANSTINSNTTGPSNSTLIPPSSNITSKPDGGNHTANNSSAGNNKTNVIYFPVKKKKPVINVPVPRTFVHADKMRTQGTLKIKQHPWTINDIPQWSLIHNDDFSLNALGWSSQERSVCRSNDIFLGGYCKFAEQMPHKTFAHLPPHKFIRITAAFHFFDKWEGEAGYMKIDNTTAWTQVHRHCDKIFSSNCNGISVCGDDQYPDKIGQLIDVSYPHTADKVKVTFGSSLVDKAVPSGCKASFGIDDVRVYIL